MMDGEEAEKERKIREEGMVLFCDRSREWIGSERREIPVVLLANKVKNPKKEFF